MNMFVNIVSRSLIFGTAMICEFLHFYFKSRVGNQPNMYLCGRLHHIRMVALHRLGWVARTCYTCYLYGIEYMCVRCLLYTHLLDKSRVFVWRICGTTRGFRNRRRERETGHDYVGGIQRMIFLKCILIRYMKLHSHYVL